MSARISKRHEADRTRGSEPRGLPQRPSEERRREWIATAAYFLGERRARAGELPDELRDWLEAEREIDQRFAEVRGHVHGAR